MRKSFLLLLAASLMSCSKLFPVDVGTGEGRGIVRRIDFEHHMITLSHGRIPNLLNPMTYAYALKNDSIMRGLSDGDTVSFTIEESQPGTFRILSLKKIHPF